ncbi:MAG UNVERIFIED_CONTAM: hypothetical protein LVT10_01775 [Anaerolineae bacterium]
MALTEITAVCGGRLAGDSRAVDVQPVNKKATGRLNLTQRAIPLTTPFVRVVATLIFPFTILIAGSRSCYMGGHSGGWVSKRGWWRD